MRLLKRGMLMFIFIIILLMCSCAKTEADFGNLQVVNILCDEHMGSGVIYDAQDDYVMIVTAAHVVEDTDSAEIVLNAEQKKHIAAEKIIRVQGLDLAFLQLKGAISEQAVLKEAGKNEDVCEKLVMSGFDAAGNFREEEGQILENWIYVEEFQGHMTWVKGQAVAGMSGGAAFDEDGSFVGIICGMDENNNIAILPASVIRSEYQVLDK